MSTFVRRKKRHPRVSPILSFLSSSHAKTYSSSHRLHLVAPSAQYSILTTRCLHRKPTPFSITGRTPSFANRSACADSPCSSTMPASPPTAPSWPLMSRRSDRALPPIPSSWRVWAPTLPIFVIILTVSALGIFNYQKTCSPIVAATLYSLRTSEVGRRELGDEIYFRDMWPWIWGELNQLHGRVDIHFGVKGTKGRGMMRFKSERRGRMGKVI